LARNAAEPAALPFTRERGRRRPWLVAFRRYRVPYLFILPFFVAFAVFFLYPIGFSLSLSLHEWSGSGPARFVGLGNYRLLLRDELFWGSMLNATILFLIYVPAMTFLALVLASLLHSRYLRLQGLWRALIFLPNITSMVAAGYVFRLMLDTDSGLANRLLSFFGVSPIPWLDDVWWARLSLGLLLVWAWLGWNTVIMLAGLQTISPELLDAARVDGANAAQIFRRITVPLLRPQILFAVTLSIIGTYSLFTEPYVLTRGGPVQATTTPVYQVFTTTFEYAKVGYGAAMSYGYFAVFVVLTLFPFWALSRERPAGRGR
jgi:lactose/L-arabinose transport system permease protein